MYEAVFILLWLISIWGMATSPSPFADIRDGLAERDGGPFDRQLNSKATFWVMASPFILFIISSYVLITRFFV